MMFLFKQIKPPPPANEHITPLPLLGTNHPQHEGINSMENQGTLNTTNFAQTQQKTKSCAQNKCNKDHFSASKYGLPRNKYNRCLLLLETDHPQKEGVNSLENQARGTK